MYTAETLKNSGVIHIRLCTQLKTFFVYTIITGVLVRIVILIHELSIRFLMSRLDMNLILCMNPLFFAFFISLLVLFAGKCTTLAKKPYIREAKAANKHITRFPWFSR